MAPSSDSKERITRYYVFNIINSEENKQHTGTDAVIKTLYWIRLKSIKNLIAKQTSYT